MMPTCIHYGEYIDPIMHSAVHGSRVRCATESAVSPHMMPVGQALTADACT